GAGGGAARPEASGRRVVAKGRPPPGRPVPGCRPEPPTGWARRVRFRAPPRWRLLSGRRRLPLRVPGLRANELEDLVDQFDVEFRVAVGRIESQRLDVGRARVEDPAQTEE